MTRIDVSEYSVLIEDNGRMTALRYGDPWRDCTGDGLVLALTLALDRIRNPKPEETEAL
jgi:hypothetical protein